jgi:hypothetical protein
MTTPFLYKLGRCGSVMVNSVSLYFARKTRPTRSASMPPALKGGLRFAAFGGSTIPTFYL